ncbi:MAG: putative ABC transporter permease [Lachnospiraceae bacterium]|nr:putative ABC transporter permease [Lachnospiraceae bacterium]
MWEVKIAGITFYYLISYMIFFSVLGWIWESFYVSITEHRVINRGYVSGPVCTIYGVGGVFMTVILQPFKSNYIITFLFAIVFTTTLEYITAVVMETLFHTSWWDYTAERFNYKGRICLKSSLAWGFASLLLFNVLLPIADHIISLYSEKNGRIMIIVIGIVYVVDFTTSTIAAMDVAKRIEKLDMLLDEFESYFKSSKLYTEGEELKNRLGAIRVRITEINYIKRYSKRLEVAQAVWKEKVISSGQKYTNETLGRLSRIKELYSKAMIGRTWNSIFQGRILRAYPKLTSRRHFRERVDESVKDVGYNEEDQGSQN